MKNLLRLSAFMLMLTCIMSCKKDDEVLSDVPEINLVNVSSSSIQEGDALVFRIQYTDGDGDLGENNSQVKNLFLIDNRVNITYEYRISQLAPEGSDIAIRGNLDIELNTTAITNGSSSQQVTYSIYVKDRAGHQSNTVTTSAITIYN